MVEHLGTLTSFRTLNEKKNAFGRVGRDARIRFSVIFIYLGRSGIVLLSLKFCLIIHKGHYIETVKFSSNFRCEQERIFESRKGTSKLEEIGGSS